MAARSKISDLLESAKDFSFEQKLSIVQSVVQSIPREQQQPWNMTKSQWAKYKLQKKKEQESFNSSDVKNLSGEQISTELSTVSDDLLESSTKEEQEIVQQPLMDPYGRSMTYFEKHLILNNFQHMTANLVLNRPEEALQYMVDWCKQQQTEKENFAAKTLFEDDKIDVYDDVMPPNTESKTASSTTEVEQSSVPQKNAGDTKESQQLKSKASEGIDEAETAEHGEGDVKKQTTPLPPENDGQRENQIIPGGNASQDSPMIARSSPTSTKPETVEEKSEHKEEEDKSDVVSVSDAVSESLSLTSASEAGS